MFYKNGVITEERFKNMTIAQWLFHYMEIKKRNNDDVGDIKELLSDINLGLQAFYLIIDEDKGKSMINVLSKIKNEPDDEDKVDNDILTDTDKELLDFANSLPMSMEVPGEIKNTGKFLLPTKSIKELENSGIEIEFISDDTNTVNLGINGGDSNGTR